jgi:hypothetical protein
MKQSMLKVAAVLAFVCGVACLVYFKPQSPSEMGPQRVTPARATWSQPPAAPLTVSPATPGPAGPAENLAAPSNRPQTDVANANSSGSATSQKFAASNQAQPAAEPNTDKLAREALSFVGSDPDAEEYWIEAINDPRLSADERQNLIEDLNEDGLSDPKHPTLDDLPLILNRLRLIEELAPNAMDQVNFDAFMEAYKDLVNLAELARGRGQPVN